MSFLRKSKSPLTVLTVVRAKLTDLLERVSTGDKTAYWEISKYLQGLYCPERSKPLLKTATDAIGFDLLVAIHYSPEEEVEAGLLPAEMTGHMHPKEVSNVVTWLTCGHALVNVLEAVDRKEVTIDGRGYSYNELINMAHANLSVSRSVLGADSPSMESESVVLRTLGDIAQTSVHLIDLIEEKVNSKSHSPHFRKRK